VPQARLVLDRLAQERRKNSVAACFGAPAAALHRRLEVAPPPSHDRSFALFAWFISHQPTVFFSQNKTITSNQPAVLFS
jgi:hypothetical protein